MQKLYTLACLAMLCASVARGGNDYRIMFQSGALTPPENHGEFTAAPEPGEMVGGYFYRLLQFYSVPTVEQKKALEQTGVILLDYMPHLTFVAALPAGYNGTILLQHNVRAVYTAEPYQKINRNLRDEVPAQVWLEPRSRHDDPRRIIRQQSSCEHDDDTDRKHHRVAKCRTGHDA